MLDHIRQRAEKEHLANLHGLPTSLKPDAQVAIIDWKKGATGQGPSHEHRFTPEEITAELEQAGYQRVAKHDFLPNQEFLVFRPAGN